MRFHLLLQFCVMMVFFFTSGIQAKHEFRIGIISSEILDQSTQDQIGSATLEERTGKNKFLQGGRLPAAIAYSVGKFKNVTTLSSGEIVISNQQSNVVLEYIPLPAKCDAGELIRTVTKHSGQLDLYLIGEYIDACGFADDTKSQVENYNLFCGAIDIVSSIWQVPCLSWSCIPRSKYAEESVRNSLKSSHIRFFPNSFPSIQTTFKILNQLKWSNVGLLSFVEAEPWNTFCGNLKDEILLSKKLTLQFYKTVQITLDNDTAEKLLFNEEIASSITQEFGESNSRVLLICVPIDSLESSDTVTNQSLLRSFVSHINEISDKAFLWIDPIGKFYDEDRIQQVIDIRSNETTFEESRKKIKKRMARAFRDVSSVYDANNFKNRTGHASHETTESQIEIDFRRNPRFIRDTVKSDTNIEKLPTESETFYLSHRISSKNIMLLSPSLDYLYETKMEEKDPSSPKKDVNKLDRSCVSVYLEEALIIAIKAFQKQATTEYDLATISNKQILENIQETKIDKMPTFDSGGLFEAPSYRLYNYLSIENTESKETSWNLVPVVDIYLSEDGEEFNMEEKLPGGIIWSEKGKPAADSVCGVNDSSCNDSRTNWRILDFFIALVLITLAYAIYIVYCKIARKRRSSDMRGSAKVFLSQEDLRLVEHVGTCGASMTDYVSTISTQRSTVSLHEQPGEMVGEDDNVLASLEGEIVFIKRLRTARQDNWGTTKSVLETLSSMRHENLMHTLGMYCGSALQGLVMEYCSRGSLRKLIMNKDYELDEYFKLSLTHDLVRGMKYIHGSTLKSHGRLKSTNCMVDARFALKITDYGVNNICNSFINYSAREDTPDDLLWTAPELLRDENLRRFGTPKGDCYSFSIICQEIFLRSSPYSTAELSSQEIIEGVKNGDSIAKYVFIVFTPDTNSDRPTITDDDAPIEIVRVIHQCAQMQPEFRLAFSVINTEMKKLRRGKKHNIVENLMERLEKYSGRLEELVIERTAELDDEKKKTEQLLMRMLPPSVAKRLMANELVVPETFEECTIYFSDICGFTTISLASSPMEVVDLLNDLYTLFDAIIEKYDVYKVETIGDAYMVSSGVPKRIGDRHAAEIALMSLDMMSATATFKIRHLPGTPLKIRIGLHSGKAVAGVVGLTMPRYCLFGDTINTASRLESTGIPSRIHVSDTTRDLLVKSKEGFQLEYRSKIELKGRGDMDTWWLIGKEGWKKTLPTPGDVNAASHGINIAEITNAKALLDRTNMKAGDEKDGAAKSSDATMSKEFQERLKKIGGKKSMKSRGSASSSTNNNNSNRVCYDTVIPLSIQRRNLSPNKFKVFRPSKIADSSSLG